MSSLEEHLKTRLLHRTTRRVSITPDGELFYQRCQALVADWEDTENMFSDDSELLGKLRVDLPVSLARRLMPRIADFLEQHPNLELELSTTDRFVDVVGEGFDCVVRVGGGETSQELKKRPLGSMTMVNAVSPAYLERFGVPETLEDLASHLLVFYQPTFGGHSTGFEYFDGKHCRYVPMSGRVTVNTADAYQAACLAGLGIIQVPLAGVRSQLQSGSLVSVLADFPAEPMPIVSLRPASRRPTRKVRVFHDWLSQELLEEPTWEPSL